MAERKDAIGFPINDADKYYVQDTRGVVGNCALWWAKDRKGYVCALGDAGIYSGADCKSMRDTDVPWPVAVVDEYTVKHVRIEVLKSLRSGRQPYPEDRRG